MQDWHWVALGVAAAVVIASIVAAFMPRKSLIAKPEHRKRRSDVVKLGNIDRVNYLQAMRLKKEGNPNAAARLLEKIGMVREAIDTLEEAHSFQAAAHILLRMDLPNRAGALLERNKKWSEAIECYRLAESKDDILRCVEALCKAEGVTDPILIEAESRNAIQDFLPAARLFLKCSRADRAFDSYILAAEFGEADTGEFDAEDLRFIASQMTVKKLNDHLLKILKRGSKLQNLLIDLLNAKSAQNAMTLIKLEYAESSQRLAVLLDPDLKDEGVLSLAEILLQLSDYVLAAQALERIGKYEDAGRVAEVAQLYFVAARNYSLAGLDRKASEMRVLASVGGSPSPPHENQMLDITSEVEHGENPVQIFKGK